MLYERQLSFLEGVGCSTKEAMIRWRLYMVKWVLRGNMNSSFHVDSIAKMLTAIPDNGVIVYLMMSQNQVISSSYFQFHIVFDYVSCTNFK